MIFPSIATFCSWPAADAALVPASIMEYIHAYEGSDAAATLKVSTPKASSSGASRGRNRCIGLFQASPVGEANPASKSIRREQRVYGACSLNEIVKAALQPR